MKLLGMVAVLSIMAAGAMSPLASASGESATQGRNPPAQPLARPYASPPPAPAPGRTVRYGGDPLQQVDVWPAILPDIGGTEQGAPLILFVHGGGWKRGDKGNATGAWKVRHFLAEGFAFASANYRLVPSATVEQQAQDIADALAAIVAQADSLGIDRHRIVLMGHSAGAHLVALVGTDPQYVLKAGLSYRDIRGIIPIDGAAYDVPAQMAEGGRFMQETYEQAFGLDPERQRALSPSLQAAPPNAPAFLILHVQRIDGVRQAKELEAALARAGTAVERAEFPGRGLAGHAEINRRLGDPDYAATPVVDDWLRGVMR